MSDPTPVTIEGPVPIPVTIEGGASPSPGGRPDLRVQRQSEDPSMPAKTTFQQDLTMAGQRVINVKWESTQQIIAIAVTLFVLMVCSFVIVAGREMLAQAAFIFMTNLAFLVIGTYFQRTNHTKTGGVGANDPTR